MRPVLFASTVLCVTFCFGASAHDTDRGEGKGEDLGERMFQVLKVLPLEPEHYRVRAAKLIENGIPDKYGHEEWAAVVMAHELHQHVGIMTVIGAKMAVRAREMLRAPTRAVRVTTETGPEPPLSCAVDGIQAGLGSTYAQQLIEAPPTDQPRLAAVFEYRERRIRLSLRPEYQDRIRQCIQSAIRAHGNFTPAYFEEIELFSYHVWATFDRRKIFAAKETSFGELDTSGARTEDVRRQVLEPIPFRSSSCLTDTRTQLPQYPVRKETLGCFLETARQELPLTKPAQCSARCHPIQRCPSARH